MKIIVFSDSHGSLREMSDAIEATLPDRIIHLGDFCRDADAIETLFPRIPVISVKGNCDYDDVPEQTIEIFGGKRLLLCHGHRYGAKAGYERLYLAGLQAGAHAVLFGHTHIPMCVYVDGLYLANPGAMSRSGRQSYAVIEISNDDMMINIVKLK